MNDEEIHISYNTVLENFKYGKTYYEFKLKKWYNIKSL